MVYIHGISYETANKLVEYMYHGEVNILESELELFIRTAKELKIKGLISKGFYEKSVEDSAFDLMRLNHKLEGLSNTHSTKIEINNAAFNHISKKDHNLLNTLQGEIINALFDSEGRISEETVKISLNNSKAIQNDVKTGNELDDAKKRIELQNKEFTYSDVAKPSIRIPKNDKTDKIDKNYAKRKKFNKRRLKISDDKGINDLIERLDSYTLNKLCWNRIHRRISR